MLATFRSIALSVMQKYAEFGVEAAPPKPYPFDVAVLPTRDDLVDMWLPLERERTAPLRSGTDTMARTCKLHGDTVFLKCIDLTTSSTANKTDFVAKLKEMKALRHKNIVEVQGVSLVVYSTTLCAAMEFMAQGSVLNVIYNKKTELSAKQMWAMCLDIAEGLAYLHKDAKRAHGSLCTMHVLVNAAGTCKLNVQAIVKAPASVDAYGVMEMAYRAPETLDGHHALDLAARQAADIRSQPYAQVYAEHGYVRGDLLIAQAKVTGALAPFSTPATWPTDAASVITRCLATEASVRPSITEAVAVVSAQVAQFA
ncbi:serine/threonine protein kinase [Saprolegnia parasitica CBS 223.65]|uniref:Serine/threonine protein kinase n=1 Tax=Saprolegnia parasitica (strain CBS 223.65) TaxID=695850 RepID=A0A067D634_SAPPC|nr:serine/threonine protein kinase [Saprolegnia parasitica CBS 223.65]KDO34472.1 serine/threonine protein kinase [Saprolegnia parasitica CBS 223.65]|eukprot:XP_012194153.1 serine/threonine protein kinase [Saprolegnia parasitica CBS 223.65]